MTIKFAPHEPLQDYPRHQRYLLDPGHGVEDFKKFLNLDRSQKRPEQDPAGCNPHQPGAKLDAGKTRAWLMVADFANALEAVARVTTVGAEKYTPEGWRTVPNGQARYMDAFMRHALAMARGETHDADTGCLHKAQACWNLLAALELELMEARSE